MTDFRSIAISTLLSANDRSVSSSIFCMEHFACTGMAGFNPRLGRCAASTAIHDAFTGPQNVQRTARSLYDGTLMLRYEFSVRSHLAALKTGHTTLLPLATAAVNHGSNSFLASIF
jgi:hypothetical protein